MIKINNTNNKMANLKVKLSEIIMDNNSFKSAVYLDVPCYHNLGDMLIYLGAKKMLEESGVTILYKETALNKSIKNISKVLSKDPEAVIFLQGGGNFGDLYPEAQDYRLKIIENFPDRKIVILPQTIWYNNFAVLEKHKKILSKANDLTIYVRDERSLNCIRSIKNVRCKLMPDTAHWLWDDCDSVLNMKIENGSGELLIDRTDGELNNSHYTVNSYTRVFDWPDLESKKDKLMEKFTRFQQKYIPQINNLVMPVWEKHMVSFCHKGISEINPFKDVITSRLHGFILSCLMRKSVKALDNNYGKNSSYIKMWLSND